jgi:hypothetical protein
MEWVIGSALGIIIGVLVSAVGMDRDRAVYPTALIVIAAYYVLFAVMGGSNQTIIAEIVAGLIFVALALGGFKWTLWLTAVGIVGHGIFDVFHNYIIHNPGVPGFWLGFCSSIDIVLGVYLGLMLWFDRIRSNPD